MKLLDNFYYDNVLKYKHNIIKLLMFRDKSSEYHILLRDLLSLYLIDFENAGSEEYDLETFKGIMDLYDQYKEDNGRFVNMTGEEIMDVYKRGQNNRISLELNKEIASIFLDLFLETHNNPYYIITKEQFEDICDHLLVE